jgi:hypothetical protein
VGQSAGASHVASGCSTTSPAAASRQVAAVMLMSGFYSAEAPLPAGPRLLRRRRAALPQRSPLSTSGRMRAAVADRRGARPRLDRAAGLPHWRAP